MQLIQQNHQCLVLIVNLIDANIKAVIPFQEFIHAIYAYKWVQNCECAILIKGRACLFDRGQSLVDFPAREEKGKNSASVQFRKKHPAALCSSTFRKKFNGRQIRLNTLLRHFTCCKSVTISVPCKTVGFFDPLNAMALAHDLMCKRDENSRLLEM
ncbi:MAG: hypothetical protein Q8N54_11215 [Sulfurimicrobium sp.]|nr:hypothetical protein [Sulfurimicrobium sp.]